MTALSPNRLSAGRPTPVLRRAGIGIAAVALALTASGCAKSANDSASSSSGSGAAAPAAAASSGGDAASAAPAAGGDAASAAPAASGSGSGDGCTLQQTGATKIDLKDAVVGFSQSEPETAAFRIAETTSIEDEAKKLGVKKLLHTVANSNLQKQIADIQQMINQGAQALIVAPLNSDGLQPAFAAAAAKHIPVVTIDRKVTSQPCKDYLTFIGSNFVDQGKRAADQLIKVTGGKAKVAVLLGSSGNNVTTDRTSGFVDEVKTAPGITIVAQQTGDFARDKGQSVTETLLQAHPDITAIYAENDEMGLGALVAIKAAGKQPGKDIKLVSIDGTKNAVQAIVDGTYNAVIESNPRFGPLAFKTLQDFFSGQPIPASIVISDGQYTSDNAKTDVAKAF
ncbi:monosaccharide ABC transporter substrate-binding protein (CUT2 family) [Motilibacter rhizosphaerae]|uniref:Monosaccharide ABC transporter substrate-binding protein (CUT2 family) n=1 Tax=Motilibacter rhizosphaerae TaxID=598652 RepID=A0A4Q7NS93_9ACTN|nr:ABC transporter substrate-binding protein [Motilibacter rhizosphaerae]RZS89961.1 monosaccharide ABC transporter substrate-binding protein (CUT2 family) [Motilibacter rhizosphaerae]